MSKHHKDASVGVARALFEGMGATERAAVEAEAESRGVNALEIVRRSLDILIARTGPSGPRGRILR